METNTASHRTTHLRILSPIVALTVAALLYANPGAVRAASIGVNFTDGGAASTLAATDLAGVPAFAQTHYNNVAPFTVTNLALNDNTGAATSARLTISTGTFVTGFPASGPDEILNKGAAWSNTGDISFTLSNIPYTTYSLIVYDLDQTGDVQGITAGGITFYTSSPQINGPGYIDNNSSTPFLYTQGTSTNPAAPTPNSNYVIFTGLTGSTQTVTDHLVSSPGDNYRVMTGFQIIQTVPEPSTWTMLLGGLLLFSGCRHFRRAQKAYKLSHK